LLLGSRSLGWTVGLSGSASASGFWLGPRSMAEVIGAWGDIKGGSTDDKHKDWSEITGFSHPLAGLVI
jgi:hypothetical protein